MSRGRQVRKRERLNVERIAMLDALGFAWDPFKEDWQRGLAALEDFVRAHGHARASRSNVTEGGVRLGAWCDRQRQDRKRGKLAPSRITALDAIHFDWEPRQSVRRDDASKQAGR